MRKSLHLFGAILALSSMPANAATRINSSLEGGKGAAVVTPINDSIDDVMRAAADADAVAARTTTILNLDSYPMVADIAGFPAAPLAANGIVAPIAPIAVVGASESFLPYLSIIGLLLVPLFLGGDSDSGVTTPGQPISPGQPVSPGQPSGPDTGLPPGPVPAIPEPATWLMMLLGFASIGMALRSAPVAARRKRAAA